MAQGVIVQYNGGSGSTFLEGVSTSEVVGELERARREDIAFVWFQVPNKGDNAVAIDPHKVAAVLAAGRA